jgi:hypothetical protein
MAQQSGSLVARLGKPTAHAVATASQTPRLVMVVVVVAHAMTIRLQSLPEQFLVWSQNLRSDCPLLLCLHHMSPIETRSDQERSSLSCRVSSLGYQPTVHFA